MTVEELEIIVTAEVEEAIKEIMKLSPAIKKQMKQIEEVFSKFSTKTIQNEFQQTIQFMKNKIKELKNSMQNSGIAIKVNGQYAQKQIDQVEKEINAVQKKINERRIELNIDEMKPKSKINDVPEVANNTIKEADNKSLDNNINSINMIKQSDILNSKIIQYNTLLNTARLEMAQLGQQTLQTTNIQGAFVSILDDFKGQLNQANISIENIKQSFSNAWNYNGNGDVVVQNLAIAFNNLLNTINNVVQSEAFESWLNWCSDKFREISEKIVSIDWQPVINALTEIGTNVGSIALEIFSGLVDIFKWLAENPDVAERLLATAIAIGIVVGVLSTISAVLSVLNPIMTVTQITLLPLIGIIAGITGAISLIVLAIMNWGTILEWLGNIWNVIVDFIVGIVTGWIENQIATFEFLKNIVFTVFNSIKDFIVGIWNGIVTTISNVWNTIVTKVSEGVSGAWNAITSIFGGIADWFGNIFRGAWEAVKNVFSKGGAIFDGIKDGILNGLKTIVNAIINGINKVIAIPFNGINAALRAIKSVNIFGLQPFSWVNTIGVPQIPTLARGGVLYYDTIIRAGEYSGASTNPEIVTPQNIMEETFNKVISRYQGNNNNKPIYLTVNVGNNKLGQILLEDLRNMKRQTGNNLEALVGG